MRVEAGPLAKAFEGRLVSSLAAALQVEQVLLAEQVSPVGLVLRAGRVEWVGQVLQVVL